MCLHGRRIKAFACRASAQNTAILDGTERGPRRDIVLLNAAAGFVITRLAPDLPAGLALAREQIATGVALGKLEALRSE